MRALAPTMKAPTPRGRWTRSMDMTAPGHVVVGVGNVRAPRSEGNGGVANRGNEGWAAVTERWGSRSALSAAGANVVRRTPWTEGRRQRTEAGGGRLAVGRRQKRNRGAWRRLCRL